MKKFFDQLKNKANGTRHRMSEYWRNLMNHSKEEKFSEGSQQIAKIRTVAHKDQWRRGHKKSDK